MSKGDYTETRTVDDMLKVIAARGLFVGNLFQLPESGLWQANLNDGHKVWEFGKGNSPVTALIIALSEAISDKRYEFYPPDRPVPYDGPTDTPKPQPTANVKDLMI